MLIHTRGLQRKKQPQSPVFGIDWSNPLVKAAGLKSVWTGAFNGRDALGNSHGALTNGATVGVGPHGKAFILDGVDDFVDFGTTKALETSNNRIVAFARIKRTGGMVDFSGVINSGKSSVNDGGWMFAGTATNTIRFYIWQSNSTWAQAESAATTVNQWHDVFGYWDGANIRIYLDGALQATTACTTILYPTTVSQVANLGQYITDEFPGEIAIAGFGDGLGSNEQAKQFKDNPWQIFEPSTRRVFIGSSGTPVSNSAIANIEALQAVAKQCQYSIESLGRAAQTYTVLIESLARVAQSAVVNIESLSRVDKQAAQNIEALAAINKAGVPNIESLATVNKSGSANIESLLSTSQARSQNVESLGGVFSPRVINIEALGGIEVAKAAIISIEALGFINKQSVLGIEALSRLAVSASITFESLLTTTKQGAANIEALAAVVVLRVQNIEAKQSVTKLSVFSFETLAGISKLFDVPIEALQGAVINIITNTVDKTVTFTLTLSKGAKFTTTLPKTIKF